MIEAWLLCKIDKGMFPGELGINFGDVGGRDVSLYSSEKFVDKEKSSLLVTVLNKGDKVHGLGCLARALMERRS
jgi:hypothetical protein